MHGSRNFDNYLSPLETNAQQLFPQVLDNAPALSSEDLQGARRRIAEVADVLKGTSEFIEETLRQRNARNAGGARPQADLITEEMIRERFYNAFVEATGSAMKEGLISRQQIEDQEGFIYEALPALSLISVVEASLDLRKGIRLDRNKVIAKVNAPAGFERLTINLIRIKKDFSTLTPQQRRDLKIVCAMNPEKPPFSNNSPHYALIQEIASHIKRISIIISQRNTYRETVASVLQVIEAIDKNAAS